ncbi:pentapeptide repeat-containing protein [Chryseobacterium arthrosphaerae]|uniref:pentapeptide repeat-containing protein n=1 Tax=Chryseobacterium arthrosphaerae TaxID=651561 RepID=UPI003211B79D
MSFSDCDFIGCNLSMAKLASTAFRNAFFKECKMLGLQFNDCNGFGLSFRFALFIIPFSIKPQ